MGEVRVVALDIGGTKIAGAMVDDRGEAGPVVTVPTPAKDGPEAILDTAAGLATGLVDRAVADGLTVQAIGVGSAGVVDAGTGMVLSATSHLPGWAGTDLVGGLRTRLGLPVSVENDAQAHAAGEAWCGAAAGVSSALLVAVGTGIGGAVVLAGEVIRGYRSAAGHLGHVPSVAAAGLPCECGGVGHVECVASGPGLAALHGRLAAPRSTHLTGKDVVRIAEEGDPTAIAAVRQSAAALGSALGGLANTLDPEIVVITGGLAEAGPVWWNSLRRAVADELIPAVAGLGVVRGQLGDRAALVGAARRAWRIA